MKRFYSLIVMAALSVFTLAACDDVNISFKRLPEKAQEFITAYFPGLEMVRAEKEYDDGVKEYKVKLSNGTEIEFDADGDWTSVSCEYSFVPDAIVPEAIREHLQETLVEYKVVSIEKNLGGYDLDVVTPDGLKKDYRYAADGTFISQSID